MKFIILLNFGFFIPIFCFGQNMGTIETKVLMPKAGVTNEYIYIPSKKIIIPDKLKCIAAYYTKGEFYSQIIPLTPINNRRYKFLLKTPDSTAVVFFAILEQSLKFPEKNSLVRNKEIVFDNNMGHGFVVSLFNNSRKHFQFEEISLAELLSNFATYKLQLKEKSPVEICQLFEKGYNYSPSLKLADSYLDYLSIKYKIDKDKGQILLLDYAKKMVLGNSEKQWLNALQVYKLLGMEDEQNKLVTKILSVYPNGEIGKEFFWKRYYSNNWKNYTEQSLLDTMNNYIEKYKDTSADSKESFYARLIMLNINEKQWPNLAKNEQKIGNELWLAKYYDFEAWKLVSKETDVSIDKLEVAKFLSKKSISNCLALIQNSKIKNSDDLQNILYGFMDTYAFILFSYKKYDSAFYYQNIFTEKGIEFGIGSMERYANYSEKFKGLDFAKKYIEKCLLRGVKSDKMLEQLEHIYQQLKLPISTYNKLKETNLKKDKELQLQSIKLKYGNSTAKDFELNNIDDKPFTLSSFKNKVVVLDFWATWCTPCVASFPEMQQLIDSYKNDTNVVFLFINVWERKPKNELVNMIRKKLNDMNFTFNVLLDIKNKVVTDYKVEAIPKIIIIDKKGQITFCEKDKSDLKNIIDTLNN